MKNEGNRMKPASNNDLEFRDSNQDNLDMDNKRASQTAIDTMVAARRRIMRQAQMLLDVDYNDIRSLVTRNLDEAKSKSLQNAFDMLEDYYQEKALAQEIGIPSVRMLKYYPAMELLETSEMEDVYNFYTLEKKKTERHQPQIVFYPPNTIITIISSIPQKNNIAADGQNTDVNYQYSSSNHVTILSEDGKFQIQISADSVNNRLRFYIKPHRANQTALTTEEENHRKSGQGILRWGAIDIKINKGIGILDLKKTNKNEQENLKSIPLIYTPIKEDSQK